MAAIQSVDDLYEHIENDEGFDAFKTIIEEWEYDFENIKDDINDEQEGDLKDEIPNALFLQIKSLINTENDINISIEMKNNEQNQHQEYRGNTIQSPASSNNKDSNIIQDAEIQKMKQRIQQKIADQNAINVIIEKIDESEYSLDNIKEDIEDIEESDIIYHLKEHNIDDSICKQFVDIINTLDETDNNITQINDYKSTVTPQTADNIKQQKTNNVTEVTDLQLVKITNLISQISNTNAAQCIIEKITEEQYEFDDIKDDIEDKDDSIIYDHLQENNITNIDQIFNTFCNMVNNIDDYADISITASNKAPQQSLISPEIEEEEEKVIEPEMYGEEFIDDESNPLYERNAMIQDRISAMYLQQTDKKDSNDEFKAASLTKLWCIFGPNMVQQMIDLKMRQLIRSFNHTDFDKLKHHLLQYEKHDFNDPIHEFFKSDFHSRKFDINKWDDDYIQGLGQYLALRFFGYDKFKQMVINHKNPRNNTNDGDGDGDDSDDEDEDDNGYGNQLSTASDDSYIYYQCRTIQMYSLAFFVAVTRHLLNFASNANYSVVLDMKIPIMRAEQFTYNDNNKNMFKFEQNMEHLVCKFCQTFEQNDLSLQFERRMNKHDIACFTVDFSKCKDERIKTPVFIGKTKEDIGVDINDKEFEDKFNNIHLFHFMRIKRLFSQFSIEDKASINNRRIGIAIHKFHKTIKLYLHYQCSVIRFQIEDIGQWFRILFKYHQNDLDLNIINKYLDKVLIDNKDLGDINPFSNGDNDENEIKINPQINFWSKVKNWKQLDQDFNEKDEKLTNIVSDLECMKQFQCVFP